LREDRGARSTWRQQGRKWRTFAAVWLPITAILLIATFFIEDLHWGARLSAVSNVIAGLGFLVMARSGSSADVDGIEITQLRTRRLPWTTVAELRPDAAGRWATSVQARLTDGTTVALPGVPAADLPRLEDLRAGQAGPTSEGS
jgi:hypothetical protein